MKLKFRGLSNGYQKFLCTCSRTRENNKNKVKTDLWDTLYNQATKTACARWCWKHNTMNTDKCVIWSYASRSRRCTLYRRCFMIRSWFRLQLVSGTPKCGEGGEFKKACLVNIVYQSSESHCSLRVLRPSLSIVL